MTSSAQPLRFLVVEDTEDIRWVTTRMVQQLGHIADEAADGVEAVEMLQAGSYDVMLLDLSMPRMTGEDVVRWLREHPEHGEGLRVVVVSAWTGERRAALAELGVDDFIAKPMRKAQLVDLVETTRSVD